jgi:hypothetical protein
MFSYTFVVHSNDASITLQNGTEVINMESGNII